MICTTCEKEKSESDFVAGKNVCYKCEYARKAGMTTGKIKECKFCGKSIPLGRWTYCCGTCAAKGAQKLKNDYWTNHVKDVGI